jgi:hypothetical protein
LKRQFLRIPALAAAGAPGDKNDLPFISLHVEKISL